MRDDTGVAALVVATVAAILGVLTVAVASLAISVAARAQASAAADAAALAAAVATYPPAGEGPPAAAASSLARANGGRLISCLCPMNPSMEPRVAMVVVGVDVTVPLFGALEVRSAGRAEFQPRRWLGR